MMTKLLSKSRALLLTLVVGLLCSSSAFGSATIIIKSADAPGVGFNDPTPVAPVGGNTGTTLGQQRFNVFQFAANTWGATLTSGPTITVSAKWSALTCDANSAVLGSAGTTTVWHDFLNAPLANTLYPAALANMLAGHDLDPRDPNVNPKGAEIEAQFNLNIGTPGCLENKPWYYGLDDNHDSQRVNLLNVVLHELGHGLGFASFTDEETGKMFVASGVPTPSVYDKFLFDNVTGKTWPQMTDAERVASAVNSSHLVWNGPQVIADASFLTVGSKDSSGRPRLFAPSQVSSGSSVSHWDTVLSPNQLMEPFINTSLTHSVMLPEDLTFSLLKDIGWCVSCPPPAPPPANDNFVSAQTISGCSGSISANNVNATKEAGEPSHNPDTTSNANPGGASVWYQWQAPSNGLVTIDLATTEVETYDPMLGVYTGNSVGALAAVAKSDDIVLGTNTNSRVQFTATAGTVYKIAAAGWGSTQGNFTLSWTQNGCGTKTDQTISFSPLADKSYGDAPFAVSATASSNLPVSFSIISGPATIFGNTVTIIGIGTVTVRASQAGNASYNPAPPVDRSFTVGKASQTITFNALPDKTYGDAPFSVSATSTSTLPVSFSVSGPATISVNTITLTGAGTVTVTASQAGSPTYNAATSVARTFTVNKAPATITLGNLSQTFNGAAKNATATTSPANLSVFISYSQNGVAVASPTNAGSYAVLAILNESNYQASDATGTLVIGKSTQTITLSSLPDKTYGDAPFNVSSTSTSGLPVSFSIVSGPATVSGSTITITGAGTVTVRASQAGDSNYNAASSVDRSFTVGKASQTINFDLIPSKTFGDAPFSLNATSTSLLPVSLQVISGPATISGSTVIINGVGDVVVRATQAGDSNYNAAAAVDRMFNVTSAGANVTLSNLSYVYDGTAKFATASTFPPGLSVSITYSQNGTPVTAPTNFGSYTVTATITTLGSSGTATGTLVINKATPVITWSNQAGIMFGTPLSSTQLNATANVPGNFQYNPISGTVLSAGTYQLSAIFIPSDVVNYNTAAASAQLTVVPAITVLTEEDNIHVVAIDSVTLMRGPFSVLNLLNFSADHRTRVTIFTSNLGSIPVSDLSVQAGSFQLPIESVGTVRGLDTSSYIIVRLVDGLAGDLPLTVKVRGVPSNAAILSIAP